MHAAEVAVTGQDERHLVHGDDLPFSGHPAGPGVADWLDGLRGHDVTGCRAILPVPGDLCGVPAGAELAVTALDAGEGLLTTGRPGSPVWLLVPEVVEFGSEYEPGVQVTWHSRRLDAQPPTWLDPVEAEHALQQALLAVTAAMEDLDIGAAGPRQLAGLSSVRGGAHAGRTAPWHLGSHRPGH